MSRCLCCNTQTVPHADTDQFLGNPLRYCPACRHVQLAEVPSAEAVTAYYREAYSHRRGGYVNEDYARIMKKRARAQIAFFSPYVTLADARVCDVGCGYGYLLEALREHTSQCWGVEYDPATVEACRGRGLSVSQIAAETDLGNLPASDLVVLSHCLEHFATPGETLRALARGSKTVFLEVPAYDADRHEQFVDQLGHIHFFNRHSLRCFFEKFGFEMLACEAFGPSIKSFYAAEWELPRKVWRRVSRDYFLNRYALRNPEGIWLRAMVRLKEAI